MRVIGVVATEDSCDLFQLWIVLQKKKTKYFVFSYLTSQRHSGGQYLAVGEEHDGDFVSCLLGSKCGRQTNDTPFFGRPPVPEVSGPERRIILRTFEMFNVVFREIGLFLFLI